MAVPPFGWWPLAFVGFAVLLRTLRDLPLRTRAFAGWMFGVGFFSVSWFWMNEFHAVGYLFAALAEAGFYALGAMVIRRPLHGPAGIVLAEAVRGIVPFGGLPLSGVALGLVDSPLAPAARLGGGLLLVALAAAIAGALARRRPLRVIAAVAVAAFVALAGAVAPDGSNDGSVRTALVQGGGRRGFRAVESDATEVLDAHLAASEDLTGELDLVLWPENTIDVDKIAGTEADRLLGELAVDVDATVIAGVTEEEDDDRFSNSSVVWSPDGEIVDTYYKVRRVPFGEYVPGRRFFSRLGDLSALPRDAVPGDDRGVLETPVGRLGIAISYEVFFSDRARLAVQGGGRMLLVPTNASSFTTSQMPTQELAAARLRAWETGRWVLQAAPTGFTAVVDHDGDVRQVTDLGERRILYQRVPLRRGSTPYTRLGDWPVLAVTALLLLVPGGGRGRPGRRGSRRPDLPGSPPAASRRDPPDPPGVGPTPAR